MKKLIILLFISIACMGQGTSPEPLPNWQYSGTIDTIGSCFGISDTAYSEEYAYCYVVFVPDDSIFDVHCRMYYDDNKYRQFDFVMADTLKCYSKIIRIIRYCDIVYKTEERYFFLDGTPFKPKKIIISLPLENYSPYRTNQQHFIHYNKQNG